MIPVKETPYVDFRTALLDYVEWMYTQRFVRKRFYNYMEGVEVLISNIERHFGVRRTGQFHILFVYQGREVVIEGHNRSKFSICYNY